LHAVNRHDVLDEPVAPAERVEIVLGHRVAGGVVPGLARIEVAIMSASPLTYVRLLTNGSVIVMPVSAVSPTLSTVIE